MNRYRAFLSRRREERERRARVDRFVRADLAPVPDDPVELPPERVDLATGLPCDRRAAARK